MSTNKSTKVGERRQAKCGIWMEIIAYRGCFDIDVKFEDETVVYNKSYGNFKLGNIKHPNIKVCRNSSLKNKRIGEKQLANCGLWMEILEYFNARNITVRFEDGEIVYNKQISAFRKGNIGHPKLMSSSISFPEFFISYYLEPLGFKKYEKGYFKKFNKKFGNKEFDLFNENLMMAIEYDGEPWHSDFNKDLLKDYLGNESNINVLRIREKGLINYESPSIKFCRTSDSFEELASILYNIVNYINNNYNTNFKLNIDLNELNSIRERFSSCKIDYTKRIGETNIARNGQAMTIIAYRSSRDIDVKFEDGTVVFNKTHVSFKLGMIQNPNYTYFNDLVKSFQYRIGETNIAKNGLEMTIIAYRGYEDIDIRFSNGIEVYHKTYGNFLRGQISIPKTRIGLTNIAHNGLKMTIIAYRNANDIDIQFENEVIVYHKSFSAFKKGYIACLKKAS